MKELERMFDFREFRQLPDPKESILFFTTRAGIAAVREQEHKKNRVAVNFVDLAFKKRSKKEKPTSQVDLFKILSRKGVTVVPAIPGNRNIESGCRGEELSHTSPTNTFIEARPTGDSNGFQQPRAEVAAGSSRALEGPSCFRQATVLSRMAPRKSRDSAAGAHESFHDTTCRSLAHLSPTALPTGCDLSQVDLRSSLQRHIVARSSFKPPRGARRILRGDSDQLDGPTTCTARAASGESGKTVRCHDDSAQREEYGAWSPLCRLRECTPVHLRESERVRRIKLVLFESPAPRPDSGNFELGWDAQAPPRPQKLADRSAFKIKQSVLTLKSLASLDSRDARLPRQLRVPADLIVENKSLPTKLTDFPKRERLDSSPQAPLRLVSRRLQRPITLRSVPDLRSKRAGDTGEFKTITLTRKNCWTGPAKPAAFLARCARRGPVLAP
jgi:hypothetical protein